MAGSGARQIWLKATVDYIVDPADRTWIAIGTGTHGKLSVHKYTFNVLSEEPLSSDERNGIPDVLEADDEVPGQYIIYDYKVWGSYKLARAIGITILKTDKPILAEDGTPVLLKSGPNKGQPKTVQEKTRIIDLNSVDLVAEEYQLNAYRVLFEKYGFPISKIIIQAIPRDGGTYVAESRGIDKKIYLLPINVLPSEKVESFYKDLSERVSRAFTEQYAPQCSSWETWEGRKCEAYCEVAFACAELNRRRAA